MLLWAIFAALTAFAAIIVVGPYWRRRGMRAGARDLDVYKRQLSEIDGEETRGLLGVDEAEAARIEIARRILAASETAQPGPAGKASPVALLIVVILITSITVGTYLIYGSPNLPDQPITARAAPNEKTPLDELIARVEDRLRQHPEDGAGWNVIAPVYMRLNRFADAAHAYRKANELLGATPKRLGNYAEALTLANQGVVTDEARQVFQTVLASDPKNDRADFWLAISEEQSGHLTAARDRYKNMLADDLPGDVKALIQQKLANVEQQLSGAPASETDQAR